MASFSCGSRLQVAYTRRPPGLGRRAALSRMAVCLATSSASAWGDWRHLRSGLRRSVPRPEQGASTSTRSILPARRLTRSSRSCAMAAGCTLDSPLRASRGLRASSRWADTSKAYSRPVLRMAAPMARVLPPAPAQKSTTISPRLASSSRASNWEPSSCTSMAPRTKAGSLVSAGLPCTRRPQGEYGVASVLIAACASSFCTCSRFSFRILTRRSSGALVDKACTRGQNSAPSCALSGSASHSGRLWRWRSSRSSSAIASHWSSHCFSRSFSAALRKSRGPCAAWGWLRRASSSCHWAKPRMARRRSRGPLPEGARWSNSSFLRSTA